MGILWFKVNSISACVSGPGMCKLVRGSEEGIMGSFVLGEETVQLENQRKEMESI